MACFCRARSLRIPADSPAHPLQAKKSTSGSGRVLSQFGLPRDNSGRTSSASALPFTQGRVSKTSAVSPARGAACPPFPDVCRPKAAILPTIITAAVTPSTTGAENAPENSLANPPSRHSRARWPRTRLHQGRRAAGEPGISDSLVSLCAGVLSRSQPAATVWPHRLPDPIPGGVDRVRFIHALICFPVFLIVPPGNRAAVRELSPRMRGGRWRSRDGRAKLRLQNGLRRPNA